MQFTFTQAQLPQAAAWLAQQLGNRKILALYGPMGAGKTTLLAQLCLYWGVNDAVGSPTYSLINEYTDSAGHTLLHMDWYRLHDEAEALEAGIEDALYSGAICLIEWPEKFENLLPEHTLRVSIGLLPDGHRQLKVLDKAPIANGAGYMR